MEENDRLQKQVSKLVCENGYMRHQLQSACHFLVLIRYQYKQNSNSFDSSEEFEQRIFSDASRSGPTLSSFYQKLDKAEKVHDLSGFGSRFNVGNISNFLDGLDESFNTLSDGLDEKLKKAATYFDYDPDEISKDDYAYRPDMNFWTGNTYDIKILYVKDYSPWGKNHPKKGEDTRKWSRRRRRREKAICLNS